MAEGTESGSNRRPPIELRAARTCDAAALGALYWDARQAAIPAIPPPVHTRDSITDWIREVVVPERHTWVSTHEGTIVGMLAIEDPDWIDQLYVAPTFQSQGIGTQLLMLAFENLHGHARLWCFQSNGAARRFYERHGFTATAWTDGDNEEGAPDVLYVRR